MPSSDPGQSLRCAPRHRAEQVDPAGNAPTWDAVMAIGIPGPWPRDISEAEPFATICEPPAATIRGADGRVWRPQGLLVPAGGEQVRVIAHERSAGPSAPMRRREWSLPGGPDGSCAELAGALVAGEEERVAAFDQHRNDPAQGTVDVLLCTHGTRDVCCGSSGTALFREAVDAFGGEAPAHTVDQRLMRTSHTGGHRFAPTALSFPEGVAWAHLDSGSLGAIVRRGGDVRRLAGHVRGAVWIGDAQSQVADREGFVRHGWDWFLSAREARVLDRDDHLGRSRIEVRCDSGPAAGRVVVADVALAGRIPRPPCGSDASPDDPTDAVWTVSRVAAAG
ncbi:MAG: sucrase ferredoxin [Microthrixaceae bacterium]